MPEPAPQQRLLAAAQAAMREKMASAAKQQALETLKSQLFATLAAGVTMANPNPTPDAATLTLSASQETQLLCMAALSHWNSLSSAAPDDAAKSAVEAEMQIVPDIANALHRMTVAQFRQVALSYSGQIKAATETYLTAAAALSAAS